MAATSTSRLEHRPLVWDLDIRIRAWYTSTVRRRGGARECSLLEREDVDVPHDADSVTLDIQPGEYVSILGPSGSGKTTLFNMIGGLDRPTAGSVLFDGIDLSRLDSRQLAWFRCCRQKWARSAG